MIETRVGYTGGDKENPSYEDVCRQRGTEGHTECVKVVYNPAAVPTSKILDVFFDIHNPMGCSSKTQYMSAIFYTNEEQHKAAAVACDAQNAKRNATIATKVLPAKQWWDAEEYHQKYLQKQTSRWY